MSIRIVPADSLGDTRQASSLDIAPLLLPASGGLYRQRAARLGALAVGHPMEAFLRFAAALVTAQADVATRHTVALPARDDYFRQCAEHGLPPLGAQAWPRDPVWQHMLRDLCDQLGQSMQGQAASVAHLLAEEPAETLERQAQQLLNGEWAVVGADRAPFIWAALSVYFSQLASQLHIHAVAEPDSARHLCPVCGSSPVASVVRQGAESGLRYLHCSLCESDWHLVRSTCSNCESSKDLGYWTLDDKEAAVRAETCGDCHGYLKIIYLDKDRVADPVADDLASLPLDARIEEEGFFRSGLNPLLFPG